MSFLKNLDAVLMDMGVAEFDCHPELPRGKEFRGLEPGRGAVSIEEAMFLAGVVWVTRPDVVIELGTSAGCSTLVLAAACKDIGKGHVASVDLAEDAPSTSAIAEKHKLPLTYISMHSMDFLQAYEADPNKQYMVFSDTDIPVRPDEVNLVIAKFPKGTVVVVHDTGDLHPFGPMRLAAKVSSPIVELPSPRGISILRT